MNKYIQDASENESIIDSFSSDSIEYYNFPCTSIRFGFSAAPFYLDPDKGYQPLINSAHLRLNCFLKLNVKDYLKKYATQQYKSFT
jgi:hypothetical protein